MENKDYGHSILYLQRMRDGDTKEEFMELHMILALAKACFEIKGLKPDIEIYKNLNISPEQIRKSKIDHKVAVFSLSLEIASMLGYNPKQKLERIANAPDGARKEIYEALGLKIDDLRKIGYSNSELLRAGYMQNELGMESPIQPNLINNAAIYPTAPRPIEHALTASRARAIE